MKETSRFYSSLGLLVLLNVVIKPIWVLGIDRQVQNETGAADYGSYFSILNLSIILSFILDFGLTNYYNRQLAARDKSSINHAGDFILLKLLFALLYATLVISIAAISGVHRWDIVLPIVLIQVLTSMFIFCRSIITSQQWFQTDAWLSVLDKMLMIVLCGIFLYFPAFYGDMSIGKFLGTQIVCTAVALLVSVFLLFKNNFLVLLKVRLPGRHIFKASFPYALILLLMAFHSRIDGFLIDRISGPSEAGKYAAAYRLLDAANMVGYLFASFLLPFIARSWSEKKEIKKIILNIRHLLLVFSISVACIVFFLAPWIYQLLYHQSDADSIRVLQWCLPALIGYSLVQVYGTVMTATGHIVAFNYITTGSIILNLVINILFIPHWGSKASCWAAIISQSFSGIATMWYVTDKLKLPIDFRSILIYIFIAALVCGLLYLISDWSMGNWMVIIITSVTVLIILWITKLFDSGFWKYTRGPKII